MCRIHFHTVSAVSGILESSFIVSTQEYDQKAYSKTVRHVGSSVGQTTVEDTPVPIYSPCAVSLELLLPHFYFFLVKGIIECRARKGRAI